MKSEDIFKLYMDHNKILIASVDLEKKLVHVFDGDQNLALSYADFFKHMAEKFELIPTFINKGVIFLDSLKSDEDFNEIRADYKQLDGTPITFVYNVSIIGKNEALLSIRKGSGNVFGPTDQMTKAISKAYIDNIARNDMLVKTPFVLAYVDIDNFNKIEEEYGTATSNMILIELVSACKDFIGNNGYISRVGGDRFLVLYEMENDYDAVHTFIFNLKLALQNLSSVSSRGLVITVTIGSSRYPFDGDNYELLHKKAYKALVRGKNKGRDCFVIYLLEKTGPVTLEDDIEVQTTNFDALHIKDNVYSLITNVNQILSMESSFDTAIDKCIALVGNYFYADRVSVARINIKTGHIIKHHQWFNHKISVKHDTYCNDEIIEPWSKALGNKFYVKIDDTKALPDDHPLKNIFPIDHTKASLAYELIVNNRSFGIIRYEMTTGKRHWPTELFQILFLISQLIATHIQKNYFSELNHKVMYKDQKYDCNNFLKFFMDVGDYVINNKIDKYIIMEIEVRNIVKYRNLIGPARITAFVNELLSIFHSRGDIIFGKKQDGPFVIFIKHQNHEVAEKIFNQFSHKFNDFIKETHSKELSIQAGAYRAMVSRDSLIDAISNASTTRDLNTTNNLIWYKDVQNSDILFKNQMLLRFDEALENNEFLLYLQPKISTNDLKLVGAEALTRWHYNFEKLLFPDQFISIFEEKNIIDRLDYKVFENVCMFQKDLLDNHKEMIPISVNVSRYITNFEEYTNKIDEIRQKYGIDPKYIEIEITEGMYYDDSEAISKFIDLLHKKGFKVSMDDFGAGYSNLVSLAKLNFDIIKFDRSFCLDLGNVNVQKTLENLISLVKNMNMSTICEGVETIDNVRFLTTIGCDSIQGYYFSKPIPYLDFLDKYYK